MTDQHFHAPISEQIWDAKYRLRDENKQPLEADVTQTWRRIAKALAQAEAPKDQDMYEAMFYNALAGFKFLPAGRITAGAGTGRKVTLSNCFTMGTIPDDMGGIFSALREAALTMQQGGGIGYDFSTLRPKGALVKGVAADASGPLTFMDVWDAMCRTIMSAGCLTGDMKVHTDQGHIPIKTIVENRMPVNVLTHRGFQKITNYFDNGLAHTIRVELETGNTITCTPDHRFHTLVNGKVEKKRIGDMKAGDKVMFAARPDLERKPYDPGSYLLGHVWANGYTQYRNDEIHSVKIAFSNKPEGVTSLNRCEAIARQQGWSFVTEPGDGDCTVLRFHKQAAQELSAIAGPKPKSHLIRFPENVETVSFIAGYFDGDGSWTSPKKGPHFDSVSRPMLEAVQRHLFDLGIPCKLRTDTRPKTGWLHLHTLSIPGQNWQRRFLDVFGGIIEKKIEPTTQQGHGFTYPISVLEGIDFRSSQIKGRISLQNKNVGYTVIESIFPDAPVLDFGGVAIMNIERAGEAHVYDLEVEDTHSYVVENVSVSNSRRGAMMATMRCDHPDIELFIEAKRDPLRLRMFNLSVLITDEFMAAVASDSDFDLRFNSEVYRTIKARDLWLKIMRNTYDFAEPGVLFIDRINKTHNLHYLETIATSNPCGEKPMGPYASCLLGSINLAMLIQNPFTSRAGMDRVELENLVVVAIRMMDNVVDVGNFPLQAQLEKAKNDRQLGLGVTGLADALIMCGLTYGSVEAVQKTELWMSLIDNAAYRASIKLAQEKGSFPGFSPDGILAAGTHASTRPRDIQDGIRKYGLRNALLTSIAPTGTISLYAGNVSSGVEPVFAYSYTRKVLNDDGTKREEAVEDFAYREYRKFWETDLDPMKGQGDGWDDSYLPDHFVSAQTLEPMAHVRMQAAAQKHVDSSISKTINVPVDMPFDDFVGIYQAAWDMGCKGCTTYRPNAVTGSILSVSEAPAPAPVGEPDFVGSSPDAALIIHEAPTERPEELDGKTYKLKWPGSNHALYITITDIEEDGRLRPFEVFINSKNMEHFAWTVALTRMISAVFRRPHDSTFIVDELKAVFDPKGGAWMDGKYVPSILAAIGGVIEKHMQAIGYIGHPEIAMPGVVTKEQARRIAMNPAMTMPYGQPAPAMCPACHSSNVKKEAGCFVCKDCGNSNCG